MKVTLTAKLKLRHTPEQKAALDAVTLSYRDALNYTSQKAFDKQVVGVDVGMRYFAVASNTSGKTFFKSGKATLRKAERYAQARKSLQQKGTRSAKRRLVALSGRERRFIADTNSSLAVQILNRFPNAFIGVEELTGVRDRTERRSRPNSSEKTRKANRRRARWSYAELLGFLAYKALLRGSMVVKVDAQYTSQT